MLFSVIGKEGEDMYKRLRLKDKRQSIIDAAILLFSEKGFHNTRTPELAKKAGVSEGTLYNYFINKDDILIKSFEYYSEKILNHLKSLEKNCVTAREKIENFVTAHINIFIENKAMARFVLLELRQSPEFIRKYPDYRPVKIFIDYLTSLIQEAVDRGEYRKDLDVEVFTTMLMGYMDYSMTKWLLMDTELDAKVMGGKFKDIVHNGILA